VVNHSAYQFYPARESRLLETETPATPLETSAYVTLEHRGWLSLAVNHKLENYRLLVRRGEGAWSVARLERDRLSANFQGNPLWPQKVLEPYKNLSGHFGLTDSSTDSACLVPLADTINGRLNELLPLQSGPVIFGFEHGTELCNHSYVDRFIDFGKLPLADVTERDSVHDWSYHFVTFLFQEYLENVRLTLEFIRSRISLFSGTTAYAWNYYGHTLDERSQMKGSAVVEEMPYEEAIYRQMAISLDVCTAKIVQLLGLYSKGLIDQCQREVELIDLFSDGVTLAAVQRILWMEENLGARLQVPEGEGGYSLGPSPMGYLLATLDQLERSASVLVEKERLRERERIFSAILKSEHCR